ncbi:RidA family protein [Salimicrobium halophilum]|uniref:Enamine deaminase RidA, house cleaning of reactive enamine intermediates, YjgF/YER057c/UK114 family n=1 Tax=Salimicrobium halophilum TaxID=86666 RepID=A0A1G8SAG7_9BACI|nr:RidA family protein [Salimicrobium halophilum]SDJ26187.1 Enamine deaminase RidA, house cleaning of reactive enamine intermediates, YjgF/YER057c/UK114 family [Salimicrobium halophilum]
MSVYERLKELEIEVPVIEPRFTFVPGVQVDNLLFISGQTPEVGSEMKYVGKLGESIDIEEAKEAARLAALNCLGEIESVLGSLDRVERFVRVIGYVRSAENFGEQPLVINGASELLIEVFGEKGNHARAALGAGELPFGAPVELEMIVQVKE